MEIYNESKQIYGALKIADVLQARGHKIAEVLKVNADYLMSPAIDKTEEFIHALTYLEELYK